MRIVLIKDIFSCFSYLCPQSGTRCKRWRSKTISCYRFFQCSYFCLNWFLIGTPFVLSNLSSTDQSHPFHILQLSWLRKWTTRDKNKVTGICPSNWLKLTVCNVTVLSWHIGTCCYRSLQHQNIQIPYIW